MLCEECLKNISTKLTPNDIYVLHELVDKTTPQTGTTRDELFTTLKLQMSAFQLRECIMRLILVDLVASTKTSRYFYYYITPSGYYVLTLLGLNKQSGDMSRRDF